MTVGWAGAGRAARGRRRHWRGALGSVQQARGHDTDAWGGGGGGGARGRLMQARDSAGARGTRRR